MSRPNSAFYFAFLVVVWAILGGVALAKGGFYLAKHEGDTLHLLQIVFRMADGEWPHLNFMTPIGVLAFAPIALFVKLGYGVGNAILLSQILVAGVLLPAVFWAGWTRLQGLAAYLFGGVVLVLALALIHGEAQSSVSISMHYNRWAWAVSYVVIVLSVLPPRDSSNQTLDGALIGLGMAALALCKITYFAAFAVPVLLVLLLRGAYRSLGVAVVAGGLVAALITALAGAAFWSAYLDDLLTVLRSDTRAQPGLNFRAIVASPAYLFGSLTALAGVILLRQAGARVAGLGLMLFVPGFFYVTYQNWANDPQWLLLLAVLVLAERPAGEVQNGLGWDMRHAMSLTAIAAIALAAPSFLNLAYSPFRHLSLNEQKYAPMLSAAPRHQDIHALIIRVNAVDGQIALDGPGSGLEDRADAADREETRTVFQGELLPDCEIASGPVGWFEAIAADLASHGYAGARLFAADLFSSHWLFGDLPRLRYGTPWYYGGLGGFDDAEFLLVPLCPTGKAVRKNILEAIAEQPVTFTEVRRTPLYIVYRIFRG